MIKVLIVDDSVVFRTQISAALKDERDINVVGTAPNGNIALQRLEQLSVDVVTLDMEMPDMDGISVLKEIRSRGIKVRVIVFSSQTTKGAEKALLALEAGADDVIAKPSGDDMGEGVSPSESIRKVLVPKILQFKDPGLESIHRPTETTRRESSTPSSPSQQGESFQRRPVEGFRPDIVVIASSTGGPTALESIFTHLHPPIKVPILIAQHMPPVFTEILARRLSELAGVPCMEGAHGEALSPGKIYVAPGNYHLALNKTDEKVFLELNQGPQRNSVRPAADYLFESAARIYGPKCLGIVLTGMGEDGFQGSLAIKRAGGRVLIQDEKSCVVFGMPGAVFRANCYDDMGDLEKVSKLLVGSTR